MRVTLNATEILAEVEQMLAAPSITEVLSQFGTVEPVHNPYNNRHGYQVRIKTQKRLGFNALNTLCDRMVDSLAAAGIDAVANGGMVYDDCVCLDVWRAA